MAKIENIEVNGEVYELPTKTSDLINDSQFQTKNEIEELVDNIQTGVSIVNQTETTLEIQPNVLNIWGKVANLTITLATPTDESIVNEYMVQFTSGDIATQLTLPDTITWMSEPTINANATYQISIINNLAIIGEFKS